MELRQLLYFTTLADTLNFSKAADKLCITQGTLSQQIRQLEAEIGSSLFDRTSRSVHLTEAGTILLTYANQTIDAARQTMHAAADLRKGQKGTLRVGVTHSFRPLLRSTVKQFIRQYPGVNLNITYSTATDLHALLQNRQLDLFVAFKPAVEYPDVESIPLFESRLSVIMRRDHPLADKKSLTIKELSRHRLALPAAGLQSRKAFERFVALDTTDLPVALETNDPNLLIEIVSSTDLLGITSSLAISYRDNLIALPIDGIDRPMLGCIHRLKNSYINRSASLFTHHLQSTASLDRLSPL